MSLWLLNLYMDGVVREVQARTLGRGAQLVGDGEEKREVSQLLFADGMVLVADSKKKLERVEEFGRVCRRRKLKEARLCDGIVGGDEYHDGWRSLGAGGSFLVPRVTGDGSRRSRDICTAESL